MSNLRYLLILVAAVSAAWAMPAENSRDLSALFNKTVCAIKVEIDENLERIPQRIKMIRCADRPEEGCESNKIPLENCCHKHNMKCVEVTDTAEVYNKKDRKPYPLAVAVGCVCMIGHVTEAPGLPQPG